MSDKFVVTQMNTVPAGAHVRNHLRQIEATFEHYDREQNFALAEQYAAFRNGLLDAPQHGPVPKFHIGDRVNVHTTKHGVLRGAIIHGSTIAYYVGFEVWQPGLPGEPITEGMLELALPEPRATVAETVAGGRWRVQERHNQSVWREFRTREQAEWFASGLIENPDWTL